MSEFVCAFCAKRKSEAKDFLIGKAGAICGECLDMCSASLAAHKMASEESNEEMQSISTVLTQSLDAIKHSLARTTMPWARLQEIESVLRRLQRLVRAEKK